MTKYWSTYKHSLIQACATVDSSLKIVNKIQLIHAKFYLQQHFQLDSAFTWPLKVHISTHTYIHTCIYERF